MARQLGLSLTLDGFFQEAHQKLRPVDTLAEGVFLCGLAHYPKSLGETVAQAQAAAQRAAGILFQTELLGRELTAQINSGKCRRCLACRGVCPFGAIQVDGAGHPGGANGSLPGLRHLRGRMPGGGHPDQPGHGGGTGGPDRGGAVVAEQ